MVKALFKDEFERSVLFLASFLGLSRSVLAIIGNLQEGSRINNDTITDIGFAVLFSYTLWMIQRKVSNKYLIPAFYFPFVMLMIGSFVAAHGIAESIEHNLFAGLILIVLSLKGRPLVWITGIYSLSVLCAFIYLGQAHPILALAEDFHQGNINFIFAALGVIGFMFYAKYAFTNRREVLGNRKEELRKKLIALGEETNKLLEQRALLEKLTKDLDIKVINRTNALKTQRKRREKYMSLTLNELFSSSEQTIQLIGELKGGKASKEPLMEMLIQSGESLKGEIAELRKKVSNDN